MDHAAQLPGSLGIRTTALRGVIQSLGQQATMYPPCGTVHVEPFIRKKTHPQQHPRTLESSVVQGPTSTCLSTSVSSKAVPQAACSVGCAGQPLPLAAHHSCTRQQSTLVCSRFACCRVRHHTHPAQWHMHTPGKLCKYHQKLVRTTATTRAQSRWVCGGVTCHVGTAQHIHRGALVPAQCVPHTTETLGGNTPHARERERHAACRGADATPCLLLMGPWGPRW